MGIKIQVLGVPEVINWLKDSQKNIDNAADEGITKAGDFVKDKLQSSIVGDEGETRSVDTGAFLASITNTKIKPMENEIGTILDYPIYLEYGTIYIPERRHFTNTAFRTNDDVIKIIIDEVVNSI